MATATQQRVIDNLVITIEADTPVGTGEPSDAGNARLYIGYPGYGQVLVWFDKGSASRIIQAIVMATGRNQTPEAAE